jgi:CBS domain-containing protein
MRIADVMTRDVRMVSPDQTLAEVARTMAECDVGILPVEENDRLAGMITDRDIVVRGLAQGKTGDTRVRDVMSTEVKYCFEDDDVDDVAHNMADIQVRRLPVVDRNKRLTGIVALGDIAKTDQTQSAAEALSGISRPGDNSAGQRPH